MRYLAQEAACRPTRVDDRVEHVGTQSRIAGGWAFGVGAKPVIMCFVIMALPAVARLAPNVASPAARNERTA